MHKCRCTVTPADEPTARGGAPEAFQDTIYKNVEAASPADAEAIARSMFEDAEGRSPEKVVCKLETLVAIAEATESELANAEQRGRLERAPLTVDGATLKQVEAAKGLNPLWRRFTRG